MLRNELKDIEELLPDKSGEIRVEYSALEFHERIQRVQEAWLTAVFSELPKNSLERYLQFHLEGISKISDTLFGFNIADGEIFQEGLLALIDHLDEYYVQLLNWSTNAPKAYHRRLIRKLDSALNRIRSLLNSSQIDPLLISSVELWLDEISGSQQNVRFTFRSLAYMEKLVIALANMNWAGEALSGTLACLLYQSNFNNLLFLKYLQNEINRAANHSSAENGVIGYFQSKIAGFMSIPLECNAAYDSSWPSIKTMVTDWLKEQINLSEFAIKKEQEKIKNLFGRKIGLNISVAHMACLIKVFYEADVFATENLRSIFKFYAANYESKRQPAISWESLSKEYYSLNSHTAARIKKILQRMIDSLNRGFFPVLAVVSVGLGIYSGNQ